MNPLVNGLASTTRPTGRLKPWEWAERHVEVDNTSTMPGKWRASNSPWSTEIMESFADNRVRDITVFCCAQGAKTQTAMGCALWAISEDPGPLLWVMASRDDVRDFVRDRFAPSVDLCKPVLDLKVSEERLGFVFKTGPVYFTGAGSPSKLQSKPIRWLFCDEVRNYKRGALDTVLKRTRSFWNSRRFIISTPGKAGDSLDRRFHDGDQRVFHVPCPVCGDLQPLEFERLKWDTNEETKPDGVWNLDAMAGTIRYECRACGHHIQDTPTNRKNLERGGHFIAQNPRAPKHSVSFTWNALLPHWVPWRDIVEEFLKARDAARQGDLEPFRTFWTETLAKSWEDELGEIEDFDFLEDRQEDYDFGDPWPEERVRFMAADRQASGGEHYWWLIRALGPPGKSRLVAYGKANSKAELEETRRTFGVKPSNAVIDSGYRASDVYRFCRAVGWHPMKGDDAEFFIHKDPRTKRAFRRLWDMTRVDPAIGTRGAGKGKLMQLIRWSNPGVKDLLFEHMAGIVGQWSLPRKVGRVYLKQLSAEHRVEEKDKRGHSRFKWHQKHRDNHLLDCECQLMVVALVTGLSGAHRSAKTPISAAKTLKK